MEILEALGGGVVFGDGLAEGGGFLEFGVEVDRGIHEQVAELFAEFGQNLAGEFGADVIEGGEDPDAEFLVTLFAELLEEFELLGKAVEREVAGLDGDDDVRRGTHGVEGEQADVGGAIDDAEIVIGGDAGEGIGEAVLPAGNAVEFGFEGGQ